MLATLPVAAVSDTFCMLRSRDESLQRSKHTIVPTQCTTMLVPALQQPDRRTVHLRNQHCGAHKIVEKG
jgi:hypothetical protein